MKKNSRTSQTTILDMNLLFDNMMQLFNFQPNIIIKETNKRKDHLFLFVYNK